MAHHVVELHVVDLVGGLRHESLEDDGKFGLAHLHLEVIEDRPEARESDETRSAAVLVLEVGFDQ